MRKSKKLIIVGDSAFAEIAYEYFTADTEYEVVAFSVESTHLKKNKLLDLPIIALENITDHYSPADHSLFVAITYTQLNRLRTRLANYAKVQGYSLASYVSPRSFIWRNVNIGEHCFIFEDNTIQPFAKIGNNVVLWSGNHIGHHSIIDDNCFVSSHVVVSGYCNVGSNSFLGVNSTVANNINVGIDNWIGPGITLSRDSKPGTLYGAADAEASAVSTYRFFKLR